MIAHDIRPISIVDDVGFLSLMKEAELVMLYLIDPQFLNTWMIYTLNKKGMCVVCWPMFSFYASPQICGRPDIMMPIFR